MRIPLDMFAQAVRVGASAKHDSDAPIRVSVYLDESATPFLVETVRDAFVPQTTSALVRVERIAAKPLEPRDDTDVALVISCGSVRLQGAVQELLVAGAPVAVIAESSVEAPFIKADTPMLGLIAATNKTYLLETLARWILDRTEKDVAFAANFPFMRIAAVNRIVTSCALANMATGALVFIPGADFPVMTAAQIGMALQLSSIFGYRLELERGYEVAAVIGAGLALRAMARGVCRFLPHGCFIAKAAIAAVGTYGMGRVLASIYERGVDYSSINGAIKSLVARVRGAGTAGDGSPASVAVASVR